MTEDIPDRRDVFLDDLLGDAHKETFSNVDHLILINIFIVFDIVLVIVLLFFIIHLWLVLSLFIHAFILVNLIA